MHAKLHNGGRCVKACYMYTDTFDRVFRKSGLSQQEARRRRRRWENRYAMEETRPVGGI